MRIIQHQRREVGFQVLGAWMLGPYIEMGCEDGSRPFAALLTGVYDRDTDAALCSMGSPEVSRHVHNVKKEKLRKLLSFRD